jgi:hypothetical protein
MRMLGHLQREIDYGYPPAAVRPTRRSANAAVTAYFDSCDAINREMRRRARAR